MKLYTETSAYCLKTIIFCLAIAFKIPTYGNIKDTIILKRIDSLIKSSQSLTEKSQFQLALEINKQAETLAINYFGAESLEFSNCAYNHGKILYLKSNFNEAEIWAIKALQIRKASVKEFSPDYAQSLNLLASVYKEKKDYTQAEQFYIECNNIRLKYLGINHPDYAQGLVNLAILYWHLVKYNEAEKLYLQAKDIYLKNFGKENKEYSFTINNLAVLYRDMGNYKKAKELNFESLDIKKKLLGSTHRDYASSLSNLAVLYLDFGEYEKVETLLLESLDITLKTLGNNHPQYAASIHSLARFYYKIGDYKSAIFYFKKVSEIYKSLYDNTKPIYINSLSSLGTSHLKNHDLANATLYFNQIDTFIKKLNKDSLSNYSSSLNELGNFYVEIGKLTEAEVIHRNLIDINIKAYGATSSKASLSYSNLGYVFYKIGQFDSALIYFKKSLSIREKIFAPLNLDYIKTLYNVGNVYKLLNKLNEAETIFSKLLSLQSLILKNSVNYLTNNELNGLQNIFENRFSHYLSMAEALNTESNNYTAACYNYILLSKQFILNLSHIFKQIESKENLLIKDKIDEFRDLHRAISLEYASIPYNTLKISELEGRAHTIEKFLLTELGNLSDNVKLFSWTDVQNNLKFGEAAIEFIEYQHFNKNDLPETRYAAFLIKKNSNQPEFISLCSKTEIEKLLNSSNNFDHKGQVNQLYSRKSSSSALYKMILFPIEKSLIDVHKIYYSSSGLLHKINLGAIPANDFQLVSEKYSLNYLSSTRNLAQKNLTFDSTVKINKTDLISIYGGIDFELNNIEYVESSESDSTNLTLANSSVRGYRDLLRKEYSSSFSTKWYDLKYTLKETEKINDVFLKKGYQTNYLSRHSATEESFKKISNQKPAPKVIHLSTHGFFFPDHYISENIFDNNLLQNSNDHPMIRSGLILAGANYAWQHGRPFKERMEDGILTAYEISQMNLSNTELVVLSACETGLGDIQGNEGVYGLQRAFKIAGVKYIIMSLWQVPDKQTSQLMITFYRKWLGVDATGSNNKQLSIPEAFNAAQKELRDSGLQPYYWAGFVLIE